MVVIVYCSKFESGSNSSHESQHQQAPAGRSLPLTTRSKFWCPSSWHRMAQNLACDALSSPGLCSCVLLSLS